MRTETLEIFKFNELTEDAQQAALDKWREQGVDYHGNSENKETLDKFQELFPVTVTNWEYGYHNFINYKMDHVEYAEILEFTGIRLLKWLVNNYWSDLFTGRFICKTAYPKHRHSKVMFTGHNCPLTGYYLDDDILDPIYKFLKKPCKHTTLEDLMNDCLNSWVESCRNDYEFQSSDEAIKGTIEANDYEFTADGSMH